MLKIKHQLKENLLSQVSMQSLLLTYWS